MVESCLALLNSRGVTFEDLVECVVFLQKPYFKELDMEEVKRCVQSVLEKREVQHALLTGITIDMKAEENDFGNPELVEIIQRDYGLYGIDEVLAYGICNLYGSIALTNYGYIDKVKPGIIGKLNDHNGVQCNTFLDDIVGAIAAAAASKLAHSQEETING